MYETCPFSREEFVVSSDLQKQAVKNWERGRKTRHKQSRPECFCCCCQQTKNSCLNFPLSCLSIVLRRGGNWPLRACGDSCLLHSFSCERQQSYLFYKGLVELCAVQLLWGKEWEGPLWYFVVAIKLSLIAADTLSINWNLPWLAAVTQPKKNTRTCTHTHTD